MDKVNRAQILESFLKNIARLSDEKYQERVWIRIEGPECNDIDDAIGDFFDGGDFILEKYSQYGITENQYRTLRNFHEKLRKFTDTFDVYSPHKSTEKLIATSEWQEIRKLGKEVLTSFNYQAQKPAAPGRGEEKR